MASSDSAQFKSELNRLKQAGFTGPAHPYRAAQSYAEGMGVNADMGRWSDRDLAQLSSHLGRTIRSDDLDNPAVRQIKEENAALSRAMGDKRANSGRMQRNGAVRREAQDMRWDGISNLQRTSMIGGGGSPMGGDVMNAIPRFYDPLEYWDLSGLPWNVADEGHRHKLHKWLRLYYATHYLVPILVDIFTRFPLVGLELEHEDPDLVEIYSEMFLNELQYEDFLVSLGREVWLVGEAFPLGSFVDTLGIWEHESLINPEDVVIDNFPLLDSQQLKIVPPDYLRRIAQTKTPPREWYQLQQNYGDLLPYLLKGEHIPMSPVVMKQVANKMNDWDDHGTPILLRGLRTLLHEEKLLASQDAIAERLYSPFILAKLGAMDMGDGLPPWIPTSEELESVRDDIDVAMASDFRVMVHHFALDMESVFGREQMPRLGDDFDRIERRLMQVFGVNPSLLSAGSNAQPYASSALQAEFMNQILRTFQKQLKEHFKSRAMVVAEAQGHYAYERKGQAQPLDAKVLTPRGWTIMGEIKPGDEVVGADGAGHRVIDVFPQEAQDIYCVTFSDGTSTRCTRDHLWTVVPVHGRSKEPVTLTVGEMLDKGVRMPSGPARWTVQHVAPVKFASHSDLPMHPYLLGLLLGDGYFGSEAGSSVTLTSGYHDYEEVMREIESLLPGGVSMTYDEKEWAVAIRFPRLQGVYENTLHTALREIGLFGKSGEDKFIPERYLRASIEDREALLQGLIDSDGHVCKGRPAIIFSNNSQNLIDGVMDLVGSLGGSARQFATDSERPAEKELYIKRLGSVIPCRLDRKVETYYGRSNDRSGRYRHIVDIKAVDFAPAQCILVDAEDHLYVTDDYLVTHNTRIPIWETVMEPDPETGQLHPVRKRKLTCPDMTFATFDLRDEATERQFMQQLRAQGVPIPDDKLMIGVSWKDKDYVQEYNRDIMYKTIQQQQAKMDTYIALVIKGLPVPADLKMEVESVLAGQTGPSMPPQGGEAGGPPPGGGGPGAEGGAPPGGAGQAGGMMMPPPPEMGGAPPGGGAPATDPMEPGPRGNVPEASNERREGLKYNASVTGPIDDLEKLAKLTKDWPENMRRRAAEIFVNPDSVPLVESSKTAASIDAETEETADPKTWDLKENQKAEKQNGEAIILEGSNRLFIPAEPGKRYALIDPLAEPLEEELDVSRDEEGTQAGQEADDVLEAPEGADGDTDASDGDE